jgi:hypothetical protein
MKRTTIEFKALYHECDVCHKRTEIRMGGVAVQMVSFTFPMTGGPTVITPHDDDCPDKAKPVKP